VLHEVIWHARIKRQLEEVTLEPKRLWGWHCLMVSAPADDASSGNWHIRGRLPRALAGHRRQSAAGGWSGRHRSTAVDPQTSSKRYWSSSQRGWGRCPPPKVERFEQRNTRYRGLQQGHAEWLNHYRPTKWSPSCGSRASPSRASF
jgi:hypothetical protein